MRKNRKKYNKSLSIYCQLEAYSAEDRTSYEGLLVHYGHEHKHSIQMHNS